MLRAEFNHGQVRWFTSAFQAVIGELMGSPKEVEEGPPKTYGIRNTLTWPIQISHISKRRIIIKNIYFINKKRNSSIRYLFLF